MKIATFNANSIRARADVVRNWLDANSPDVLCVQETKVQDSEFPVSVFDGSGYEIVFRGQKSYNGVAVFSRHGFENVSFGLDSEPADEPRLADVKVKGINIVNTYIPQGYMVESDKFAYKMEWFKRLRAYFDKKYKPADKLIWLGDLNVAPTDIDVHDPKRLLGHVCFCPEVWGAFENVKSWGFVDLLRKHYPDERIYTFWDYRSKSAFTKDRGWRIDIILAAEKLAKKCTDCYVDREPRGMERPSDHTFLIAEFDL
jgi:exodeoxyribonuclease III